MALKKMIDADKICADQSFLRESASLFSSLSVSAGHVACCENSYCRSDCQSDLRNFRSYRCQPVVWPVVKMLRAEIGIEVTLPVRRAC